MKPKLLKTLNMNQFQASWSSDIICKDLKLELQKIRIWKMGKNCSPWTKFDPLTAIIFWIYNFSSLDIIKFVSIHKS